MALVAARDQRAFRMLMERHMARAIGLAERVVGNADADDVAQEAFLRVWRRAGSYDPAAGRFTTWLYRIVLNLAIDGRRRQRHVEIEQALEVPDGAPGPVQLLMAEERGRWLAAAMAALPERQRAALALFHMEGLSAREAAQVMNVTEKAFESLLTRARSALRQRAEGSEAREAHAGQGRCR